jgi:hypothetical protein
MSLIEARQSEGHPLLTITVSIVVVALAPVPPVSHISYLVTVQASSRKLGLAATPKSLLLMADLMRVASEKIYQQLATSNLQPNTNNNPSI